MTRFGFEDLAVWQRAVELSNRVVHLVEHIRTDRKHFRLVDQLEASATSVALNIAEGKGRYSKKEFVQFLYIARGSLYETITLLVIFYDNKWIDSAQLDELKAFGDEINKMLSSLIKSIKSSMNER